MYFPTKTSHVELGSSVVAEKSDHLFRSDTEGWGFLFVKCISSMTRVQNAFQLVHNY